MERSLCRDREGETLLSGEVVDQAALYGLLAKLRDLGLSLLSVRADLVNEPLGSPSQDPAPIEEQDTGPP